MLLDNTERLYLERQVTLARAVIAALSLVALLETSPGPVRRVSVVFFWRSTCDRGRRGAGRTILSAKYRFRIPLAVDFVGPGRFRLPYAFGLRVLVSLPLRGVCAGDARK